ncbi:MAG: ABC transporter substrate-binding protein, partial [Candidatus Bathyarchaeia archaeon]
DAWTEPGNIVTNGPYLLASWEHGTSLSLKKNPDFFNAANVQIGQIDFVMIEEESTAMALYEAGDLDALYGTTVPVEDLDRVKSDPTLSKEFTIYPELSTYWYGFNLEKPPFDNVLVRKAFAAAIDREALVNEITKGGELPTTVFTAPEDFEDFPLPDPDAPGWTFAVEHARRVIGEDVALATFIRDPFSHAWEMFTPLKFVVWMYQRPRFIERVLEELTDFNVGIIKHIAESEVDLIISGGDYCEVKGPMVPTRFFKEVIFPCLRRQVEASHRRGIKFIKHTDGDVLPLLDDLAEIVDGLHSLDPTAGVDIGEVKAAYGHKLVLMGNVAVDTLAKRTRAEVVEETKSCIRRASPGGGHILSSSNSWAAGAILENCMAMVEAGRKYGVYPIRV